MNVFARITLPLAGMNFINQASRTLVATIGPLLAVEYALSAGELGLLAAVFFMAYAAAQLPLGLAMDLYGPRRVQSLMALVAATGFLLCAVSVGPIWLGVGRAITGVGIAGALIALLKAHTQWLPRHAVAGATGLAVFLGAMGGLAATLPVQALLPLIGWRGAFVLLAGMGVALSLWVWLSVPHAPPGAPEPPRRRLLTEIAEIGRIFPHPVFVRLVPGIALLSALNFTWQGLWAGPWLRDVGGLGDTSRATVLMGYAAGVSVGSLLMGRLSSRLQRRGQDPMLVPFIAMGGMALCQILLLLHPFTDSRLFALVWFGFAFCGAAGPSGYAAVGQSFGPQLAGRVATAINATMLALVFLLQTAIGQILDLWPRNASGGWEAAGYGWALAMTLMLQAGTTAWAIWRRR
ncbi:putative MFS family arabinose efflux permease [Humitalea rosea]|uniref:Putative MFS family arabinose efflux permease n=1 Tax=Humitalea rosea TaxID=990373 RepID=A0A2W7IJF9_9PROT|nr:MFS transporter [Humitalea rosea]PZW38653.1 putative MFS family arabinose efflux permease [Humitalea rosea]